MLLKGAWNREWHVAKLATIGFGAYPTMGLHVARQLRRLGARIAAQLALVRFLSCVGPSMDCKIRTVFEDLSTELASIISISVVIPFFNLLKGPWLVWGDDPVFEKYGQLEVIGRGGPG